LSWMKSLAAHFGYLGVFLVSLVGAMSVVVPIPYTLFILTWTTWGPGLNPLVLGAMGAAGSAIGEFFGYALGYLGRAAISEERQRKMGYIVKIFDRYGPIVIFLFALTPLPDDLLFIPLGVLRYSFVRAFLPCFLGKLLMCYILVYAGQLFHGLLTTLFGEGGWVGTIFTSVLLVLIFVVMYRIDWERVFERYVAKGEPEKR